MKGIYKITNIINNKMYIGESQNIERRWQEHIEELNNNKHGNYKLQDDWNTYGRDNFTFEILEEIKELDSPYKTKMQLIYIEDKYIKQYNSILSGYNLENTVEKILNEEKTIVKQPMDKNYLQTLIKYNGKHKKKIIKVANNNDKTEITLPVRPIDQLYNELLQERYDILSEQWLYDRLVYVHIFFKQSDTYYISKKFLNKGYFHNGKEKVNNSSCLYWDILVTDKGKDLIINKLNLKNK